MRKSMTACGVLGVLIAMFTATSPAFAQNGAIDFVSPLCGNTPQSAGSDIAYNTTSNNSMWVLDQGSGQVCRYTLSAFPPDILFSLSVNHPFGAAAPPFFSPLCSGIAYRPTTQTLFVMNASTLQIVEMDQTGNQIGLPVNLSPPLPDASVSGLAFDTVTNNLWYRDTVNDIAVECNPATGATVSQIALPGEPVMYGSGLTFNGSGGRWLEFTRGNVLDFRPSKMVRINAATGALTCVEVDLTQVPDPVLGVVRPQNGTVIYATTATDVYKIDSSQPAVLAPTDLRCFSNVSGTVSLTWRNCGPGAGGLYTSVRILRSGVVIQILGGSTTSYTDPDPEPSGSELTYQVQGIAGATVAGRSCTVQTGPGGMVNYTMFGGTRPYDLALDPGSGQLYVTDNFSDLIYVYDTDLNLLSVISTGLQNLQGVAYNTNLNVLLVSRTGSTLLTPINPLTGLFAGSQIPVAAGSDVSAITYDSLQDDYLFVNAAANPVQVVRIDATPPFQGNFLGSFTPPGPSGLLLGRGISHLSQTDTVLVPVQQGATGGNLTAVTELFTNGFPTGFSFGLDEIGGSISVPNSVRGIEDLANVAYLAGSATNTIFRVLIAAGGSGFVRGEVNGSPGIDLSDAIYIANYLYTGGTPPICLDAADVNDSGSIDISDPLYLILYLFISGAPPPAPFPTAGPDPTFLDPLGC